MRTFRQRELAVYENVHRQGVTIEASHCDEIKISAF